MADRPYTVLSSCMSLDGYIGGGTARRLVLSNEEDLDRVDALRASCDAILVGAGTVRADDPRLLVRSEVRRAERQARGRTHSPLRVTVTRTGDLDPTAQVFTTDDAVTIVYSPTSAADPLQERLRGRAEVIGLGTHVDLRRVSEDLSARGVDRLLVEGGATITTQFITGDLADQLDLVVAPFFVGDERAQRFVGPGSFPWSVQHRAALADVQRLGDVVLLQYALSDRFGAA
jgi:5-amino-6-(5-phosphoribosylamino)uracil reductase